MAKSTFPTPVAIGLGVAAVAGIAALVTSSKKGGQVSGPGATWPTLDFIPEPAQPEPVGPPMWVQNVILRVSAHEGGFSSLNRNTDKAGLSFGIIQWSQVTGQLGVLLDEMFKASPELFKQSFGEHWQGLLDAKSVRDLLPIGGALLWEEPWVLKFKSAGRKNTFQGVQMNLAMNGEHFRGALRAAQTLFGQTYSERAVALMYDRAVQQGPGFAKRLAQKVLDQYQGQVVSPFDVLHAYAYLCPAHFRRVNQPGRHGKAPRLEWKAVGQEWHVFAGSVDLYTNVLKRRVAILDDVNLGDGAVLGGAGVA